MDLLLKYGSLLIVGLIFLKLTYDFIVLIFPNAAQYAPRLSLPLMPEPASLNYVRQLGCSPYSRVTLMFIVNRLLILLAATFIYSLVENKPIELFNNFYDLWYRWDTRHYLYIAEHGYPNEGNDRNILVFYPLFPMLVKFANIVINEYFYSGLFVSNVCLLAACIMMFKLTQLEFKNESISGASVQYLLIFPLSFFGSMSYTESLFLLLSVSCFYFIRKEMWWQAGLIGMLASLTRNQGIVLFAPMAYEFIRVSLELYRQGEKPKVGDLIMRFCFCLLIPLGFVLYLCLNKYISGDWFRFLEYQRDNWHQKPVFFADNIVEIYKRINFSDPNHTTGIWIPTTIVFMLVIILLPFITSVLPAPYIIYTIPFFVICYTPSWLISGPRYLFVLFPMYMALAKILHKRETLSHLTKLFFVSMTGVMLVAFFRNSVL